MSKEIKVVIDSDGKVIFETSGVKGSQCLSLTDQLEKGVGTVMDRKRKSEFYQTASTSQNNTISNKRGY